MNDRLWPQDWQAGPRYGGLYTFARVPASRDLSRADAAIIGVPMDMAAMYRSGARFGPRAIRDASGQLRPHALAPDGLEEPFASLRVIDYGDIDVFPGYLENSLAAVQSALEEVVAAQVFPIVLGGDHSSTLPALRACARRFGTLSLVHFDAHPDFWRGTERQPIHHGTVFRQALEEQLIDPAASVQIGIRGSLSAGIVGAARAAGFSLITVDEVAQNGTAWLVEKALKLAWRPTYISIDVDCLDAAFAPGTGTPEVGGFSSRELLQMLRGLSGLNFVGLDVVEVAPQYDSAEITALLAANLIYEALLLLAARRAGQSA